MTVFERLSHAVSMTLVAALSLGLLIYVGWADAKRNLPDFETKKMAAQGELVQTAMESFLRAGLPLDQFVGFAQIAEPTLDSDPDIISIAAYDADGRQVFGAGDTSVQPIAGQRAELGYGIRTDGEWLQIALPLRDRFQPVGDLIVTMKAETVVRKVSTAIIGLLPVCAFLVGAFFISVLILGPRALGGRVPWIGIGYVFIYFMAAMFLVVSLITLYAEGAQSTAKAMGDSLSQRIAPVFKYGLSLNDLSGLDEALSQYHSINPEIRDVAVILDEKIVVRSGEAPVGGPWLAQPDSYEFLVPVAGTENTRIAVALPKDIVFGAVVRSVKNFAALFLASCLLAWLFLGLAQSRTLRKGDPETYKMALIKPIFFLAIFTDNLGASFMPQLLDDAAAQSGLGQSASSMAFTAYFMAFLVVLLPVSAWIDRNGPRGVMVLGTLSVAVANAILASTLDLNWLVIARALAGLGQGLIFIGFQYAIMIVTPESQRTRAAAVIVFGFNGGMIAGAAIGSLLVSDISAQGVFLVAICLAVLLALYTVMTVPSASLVSGSAKSFGKVLREIPSAFQSLGFLRSVVLIGVPSKAVLTGVVMFAIPLLLHNRGWAAENIGQVIMLYSVGVILSSTIAARIVDRLNGSRASLVLGGLVSVTGIVLVGLGDIWRLADFGQILSVVSGAFLIGLAHGLINAPIITYVGATTAAESLGRPTAVSLYRIVERLGHVSGPIIIGQMMLFVPDEQVLVLAALLIFSVTLVFSIPIRSERWKGG
ncbi:MFS transporter [Tabrizicola sp.]|uniref:MFS transporter n=1 Tax=Tabrizicola sp. TaxID=2005166 RepID=UPI003D2A83C8